MLSLMTPRQRQIIEMLNAGIGIKRNFLATFFKNFDSI